MRIPDENIFSIALVTVALAISIALWAQGWFLGALLVMLVSGGIATAQPRMQRGKVVLRGTPVVAMFAIMLASASGMTMAIDEVTSRMSPQAEAVCDPLVDATDIAPAPNPSAVISFVR